MSDDPGAISSPLGRMFLWFTNPAPAIITVLILLMLGGGAFYAHKQGLIDFNQLMPRAKTGVGSTYASHTDGNNPLPSPTFASGTRPIGTAPMGSVTPVVSSYTPPVGSLAAADSMQVSSTA